MALSFLRRRIFCATVGASFCLGSVAHASHYIVENTNDSGPGSLRAAMILANTTRGADTISFAPSLAGRTITLTSGQLSVISVLSIDGAIGNLKGVTINGGNKSRVFFVNSGNNTLSLSNLNIVGGKSDYGAGVASFATLNVSNCTFSNNAASNLGGAVFAGNPSVANITNCTFANNQISVPSGGGGGAIMNNGGTVNLKNSTLSGNTGPNNRGGIYNSSSGVINVSNTILNDGVFNGATLNSQGYNLSKRGNGFQSNSRLDKVAPDLRLAALAYNGGLTPTVALLPESPALDAGNATGTDQRGLSRPVDMVGIPNASNGSDIGAYEQRVPTSFVVTTASDVVANDGLVSLREAITAANNVASTRGAAIPISFDSTVFGKEKKNITVVKALPQTKGNISIVGPVARGAGVTIDGPNFFLFNSGAGTLSLANLSLTRANIGVVLDGGEAVLRSCTLSQSSDSGAAIFVNPRRKATLENCTISDNKNRGVYVGEGSTVTMRNCTVTKNAISGVFLYNQIQPAYLNISNCIVAGNGLDFETFGPYESWGTITTGGYNLIGNNAGVEAVFPAGTPNSNNDLVGTVSEPLSAKFAPSGLKDNGGPTPTIALLGDSPAINAGKAMFAVDQRGIKRDSRPDIGAYELGAPSLALTLTPTRPFTNDTLTATATASPEIPAGPYLYTFVWFRTRDTEPDPIVIKATNRTTNSSDTLDLSQELIGNKGDLISVAVTVTDSGTGLVSSSVGRSVRIVNTAPTASALTVRGVVGQSINTRLVASDDDGDKLTYSSGPLPAGLSLNSETGVISGTPTVPVNNLSVAIRVRDGEANTVAVVTFDIVEAKSLMVNVPNDTVNPYDGKTSLREAILASDLRAKNNVITFDARAFTIHRTIFLNGSSLDLNANTTIVGPRSGVTVDARNSSRVFDIGVERKIGVVISNLSAVNGSAYGNGGGFNVPSGSTLVLSNCTVAFNTAREMGGAIFLDGDGVLSLNGCTLSGNSVSVNSSAGAIHINSGRATLVNCTLSGNRTPYQGDSAGAIWTKSGVTLSSCTIANNLVFGSETAGGVYVAGGALVAQNTIIAANSEGSVDIVGPFASRGYNLIGSADDSTRFASTDLHGTIAAPLDPKLAPLASNGGLTKTHALLRTSPALDAGNSTLAVDQRGAARPQGTTADIGSFEAANSSGTTRSLDNNAPSAPTRNSSGGSS